MDSGIAWWEKRFVRMKAKSKVPIDKIVARLSLARSSSNISLSSLSSNNSFELSPNNNSFSSPSKLTLKDLFDNDGFALSPKEYNKFWNNINDPESIVQFITACIQELMVEKKNMALNGNQNECNRKIDSEITTDKAYLIQCIKNTIYLLDLFYNIRQEENIPRDIHQIIDFFDKTGQQEFAHQHSTSNRSLPQLNYEDFIDLLIKETVLLDQNADNRMLKKYRDYSYGDMQPHLLEIQFSKLLSRRNLDYLHENSPFNYLFLKLMVLSRVKVGYIFSRILVHLDELSTSSLHSHQYFIEVFSLLYIFEEFLISCPSINIFWLQEAKLRIQPFTSLPEPLNTIACRIIESINFELSCPGFALRERYKQEHLHIFDKNYCQEEIFNNTIYVVLSRESPQIRSNVDMMKQLPLDFVHSIRLGEFSNSIVCLTKEPDFIGEFIDEKCLIRNYILSYIQVDFRLNGTDLQRLSKAIDMQTRTKLSLILNKFYYLEEVCSKLALDDGKKYRESFLANIFLHFVPGGKLHPIRCTSFQRGTIDNSCNNSTSTPKNTFRLCGSTISDGHSVEERASISKCISISRIDPSIPPNYAVIRDDFGSIDCIPCKDLLPLQEYILPEKISFRQIIMGIVLKENQFIYGKTDIELFKQYKHERDFAVNSRRTFNKKNIYDIAKICITGGDFETHRILCAYVFVQKSLQLFVEKCQFYLLPDGENKLAKYIAVKDAWYCRQVYYPFIQPLPIIPELRTHITLEEESPLNKNFNEVKAQSNQETKNNPNIARNLPHSLRRSLIEEYIRSAKTKTHVRIFECECWHGSIDSECILIPFATRVDIGVLTTAKMFLETNYLASLDIKLQDILQDPRFYSTNLNKQIHLPKLSVKYKSKSLSDCISNPFRDIDENEFLNISIFNYPCESFGVYGGNLVNPADALLELSLRPLWNGNVPILKKPKNFRAADGIISYLKTGYLNENNYSKDEECNSSVRTCDLINPKVIDRVEIKCVDPKDNFNVMIDGQIFGPFIKVIISPSIDAKSRDVHFPVMNFFPNF